MKNLLRNIWLNRKTILQSLYNKYIRYTKFRNVAEHRLNICASCPFNSKNTGNRPYGQLPYNHCTKCGCALYLKTFSSESSCPENKW